MKTKFDVLVSFEVLKLLRSRRPAVAVAALVLFLTLMLLGFYTYAKTETGGQVAFRYTYENENYFNGLTFALYAYYFGVLMVLPIFAATEGGAQLAGETASKTLNLMLTRPLSRSRIFLTKFVIAALYMTVLVGLLLAATLGVGLLAVGWGELNIYPGVLQMTDQHQHLSQREALRAFLLAWPAASVALLAPLALGFLLSVWIKHPINAVAASVATYLVLYVVSQIHFFRELGPFLFTTHLGYWRDIFREQMHWPSLLRDGAKLLAFAFGFLALAHHRFRVREEI